MKKVLIAVLAALIAVPVFAATEKEKEGKEKKEILPPGVFRVKDIIDGNTFTLTDGQTVQLIGVDTYEVEDNEKARADSKRTGKSVEEIIRMGKWSADFLRREIKGKKARLEFDEQEKDQYGRLLAYVDVFHCGPGCTVWNAPYGYTTYEDGVYINLNAFILYKGYGMAMTIPPNLKNDEIYKRMYEAAKFNKRGLWADRPSQSKAHPASPAEPVK